MAYVRAGYLYIWNAIHKLGSLGAAHLNYLTCALFITPKTAPAFTVALHQSEFELRVQDLERGFCCIYVPKEGYLGAVSFVVTCWKIEIHCSNGRKVDFRPQMIDLLQEETCDHGCGGLIEVLSVRGKLVSSFHRVMTALIHTGLLQGPSLYFDHSWFLQKDAYPSLYNLEFS